MAATIQDALGHVKSRLSRYRGRSLNEQDTKATLIEPILRALGWDLEDLEVVQREHKARPRANPVDYALFSGREPVLFVEAKALGQDLGDEKWASQVLGCATVAGAPWAPPTNGDEYRICNAQAPAKTRRERTIVRAIGVAVAVVVWTYSGARGASEGDITWLASQTLAGGASLPVAQEALRLAVLNPSIDSARVEAVERGYLVDEAPFGLARRTEAYRVHLSNVLVRDAGNPADYAFTEFSMVLDIETGQLLCAYRVRRERPELLRTERDLEATVRKSLHWEWSDPGPRPLASSVADVIGGAWAYAGVFPPSVPYLVVRPRMVQHRYPASLSEGGRILPDAPGALLRWIVETRGCHVVLPRRDQATHLIASADDGAPATAQWTAF